MSKKKLFRGSYELGDMEYDGKTDMCKVALKNWPPIFAKYHLTYMTIHRIQMQPRRYWYKWDFEKLHLELCRAFEARAFNILMTTIIKRTYKDLITIIHGLSALHPDNQYDYTPTLNLYMGGPKDDVIFALVLEFDIFSTDPFGHTDAVDSVYGEIMLPQKPLRYLNIQKSEYAFISDKEYVVRIGYPSHFYTFLQGFAKESDKKMNIFDKISKDVKEESHEADQAPVQSSV